MRLSPDDYKLGAMERVATGAELFKMGRFSECIYLAGLAVECMLRAYRVRRDPTFDSRHDLPVLMKASGLEALVPGRHRRRLGEILSEAWTRWRNEYRFASADRISSDLRRRGLFSGIKGDALKFNARRLLDCAHELVALGCHTWNKSSSV